MKLANNTGIRAFCKEGEDKELLLEKLKLLLPFDVQDEKIKIEEQTAEGFDEKRIVIISVILTKDRQINAFIDNLLSRLGDEKKTLLEQLESRLDSELNFFIRLDKEMLLKDKFVLTDSGNCYHIKISMAAFPKRRETATTLLKGLLSQGREQE